MTIIGVDKNGDEIAEVSVLELDTMFKEIRNKAIDDFVVKLKEEKFNGYETLEDYFEDSIECVTVEDIVMIAEQLKEGSADNEL